MSTRWFLILIVVFLTLGLVSCNAAPSDAATGAGSEGVGNAAQQGTSLPPGEILHIFGEESYTSEPVTLEGAGILKVYYRQDCSMFILKMVNTNQALAEAPFGTVIFAAWREPYGYVEDDPEKPPFEYIPGEYRFTVEVEGPCNWEVWAVVEYPQEQ